LKDLDVNGRIILNGIFENFGGDMNWIDLAEDRDRWCALVKAL
jgi:hypothetical protein